MTPPLFAHQVEDVQFCLEHPHVFNTSDPGTGKTRTCLEVIRRLKLPTLICAPKSILRAAWEADAHKFTPELKVSVAYANNRREAFEVCADVYITNIDATTWLVKQPKLLEKFRDGLLIVDESTAYKHHTAQRSKAAQQLATYFARRILLTGTPNPNGILDVWGQMYLLDGGQRLGKSFYGFRQAACAPVQTGRAANMVRWEDKPGVESAVFDMISDCTIRHRLEDVLDMPENVVNTIECELTPEHRAAYEHLAATAMLEFEQGQVVTAVNAATLLTKLLQCLSGSVYDEDGKPALVATERYELILDLIEQRKQCVVAFLWKHQKEQLVAEATKRKLTFGVIDGETPAERRSQLVDEFQAGKLRVIFAHPQSAGHGLTLTKGTTTIWASPTFNAEFYDQFNHRTYRAGQTQRTETIHIAARDTHEQEVYRRLTEKLDSMSLLLSLLGESNE